MHPANHLNQLNPLPKMLRKSKFAIPILDPLPAAGNDTVPPIPPKTKKIGGPISNMKPKQHRK